jgi:hypothetical protein
MTDRAPKEDFGTSITVEELDEWESEAKSYSPLYVASVDMLKLIAAARRGIEATPSPQGDAGEHRGEGGTVLEPLTDEYGFARPSPAPLPGGEEYLRGVLHQVRDMLIIGPSHARRNMEIYQLITDALAPPTTMEKNDEPDTSVCPGHGSDDSDFSSGNGTSQQAVAPIPGGEEHTPCNVKFTERWGHWCYVHNRPAYKSHSGFVCYPDAPQCDADRQENDNGRQGVGGNRVDTAHSSSTVRGDTLGPLAGEEYLRGVLYQVRDMLVIGPSHAAKNMEIHQLITDALSPSPQKGDVGECEHKHVLDGVCDYCRQHVPPDIAGEDKDYEGASEGAAAERWNRLVFDSDAAARSRVRHILKFYEPHELEDQFTAMLKWLHVRGSSDVFPSPDIAGVKERAIEQWEYIKAFPEARSGIIHAGNELAQALTAAQARCEELDKRNRVLEEALGKVAIQLKIETARAIARAALGRDG